MRWILFALTCLCLPARAVELDYVASYRGLLSAGARLAIADVHLSLPDAGTAPARLTVTTAPYPKAEWIHPLRFDYRAWLTPGDLATRQVAWSKTDREGREVRRLCFDCEPGVILGLSPADDTPLPVNATAFARPRADLRLPWNDAPPRDRMAMLQRLRKMPLTSSRSWFWPVSNGGDLRGYRIEVGRRKQVLLHHRARRIVPVDLIPVKDRVQEDRRIRVWLEDAPSRIPLRFTTERALGEFRVELKAAPPRSR